MKLDNKKMLAAKTLGVGIDRIKFDINRLDEIKEAITKQDIRDLAANGAIKIKEINGRKSKVRRNTRRKQGKVRRKPGKRKKEYVIVTRKLRKYIKELVQQKKISKEKYKELRKKIKMKEFKSKRQMKEGGLQ